MAGHWCGTGRSLVWRWQVTGVELLTPLWQGLCPRESDGRSLVWNWQVTGVELLTPLWQGVHVRAMAGHWCGTGRSLV
eukprot:359127-Chlamydomonas_euryale.AAC.1